MKRLILAMSMLGSLPLLALNYTDVTWQPAGVSLNGSYTDAAHWNPAVSGGPGSGWPTSTENINQRAVFPRQDADYAVSFPQGEFTSIASMEVRVQLGRSVTFDGSSTRLVMPTLSGGAYYRNIIFCAAGRDGETATDGPSILRRPSNNTMPAYGTFGSFTATLSSRPSGFAGTVLDIAGDISFTGGNLFVFGDEDNYSTRREADGSAKVRFHDGTFSMPGNTLETCLQNPTNILELSNMTMEWPKSLQFTPKCNTLPDNEFGLWMLHITDGSVVTNTSATAGDLQIGYLSQDASYPRDSVGKKFIVRIDGGSSVQLAKIYDAQACDSEYVYGGPGTKVKLTHTTSIHEYATKADASAKVSVLDGAELECVAGMKFGGDTEALSASKGDLIVSNGTVRVSRDLKLQSGAFRFLDGAHVYLPSGTYVFGGSGYAGAAKTFVADGATFHYDKTRNDNKAFEGFTSLKLGPKGATVVEECAKGYEFSASFTDLSTGGTLTMMPYSDNAPFTLTATDSAESYLVIARGTTKLAAGASHHSHLVVTNNATFSLAGGAVGTTLRGITLGNAVSDGTLALDADETVAIEGPINLVRPRLTFATTLSAGTHTVFRKTVKPADAEIRQWGSVGAACVASGLNASLYHSACVTESSGAWLFQIVSTSSLPSVTGTAVWTGPGTAWKTAENWQNGMAPSETLKARFAGATPKQVTVAGSVPAAAVELADATGYEIAGGEIALSRTDASAISAEGGDNEISSSLRLAGPASVPVASGAQLTLSGPVTGGGLAKSGTGRLVLSSEANDLPYGVGISGGWLSAYSPLSLGNDNSINASVLSGGTLEFYGAGGRTPAPMAVTGPIIYKSDFGVTMPLPTATSTSGAIIKRGAGKLTFETALSSDQKLKLATTAAYAATDSVTFPADGSAPSKYLGLTIAEGEVCFRGTGERPRIYIGASGDARVALGVPGADASVQVGTKPVLSLDNVHLVQKQLSVGVGVAAETSAAWRQEIRVCNGSRLDAGASTALPYQTKGAAQFFADRGVVNYGDTVVPVSNSDCADSTNKFTFANDSALVAKTCDVRGSARMAFTNSVLVSFNANVGDAQTDRTKWTPCQFRVYPSSFAQSLDLVFARGAVFGCREISLTTPTGYQDHPVNLTFDGGEWWPGTAADVTLASSNLNVRTVVTGEGLLMQPASGQTWRWITKVEGNGAFVKRGAGTVVFECQRKAHEACTDKVTLANTGLIDVREGVLALRDGAVASGASFLLAGTLNAMGGMVSGAVIGSAGGDVLNGTFASPTVGFPVADDGSAPAAIVFDYANGFRTVGRVRVDFGRATGDPLVLGARYVIGRWTGSTKPDISRWKGVNLGDDRACAITATDDGEIVAVVTHKLGFVIVVR